MPPRRRYTMRFEKYLMATPDLAVHRTLAGARHDSEGIHPPTVHRPGKSASVSRLHDSTLTSERSHTLLMNELGMLISLLCFRDSSNVT